MTSLRPAIIGLSALLAGASVEQVPTGKVFRPVVRGMHGAVAAGNPMTVEAGLGLLRSGGNAVDAGVAATFAAAVTEFSHFALGGEASILIYVSKEDRVVAVNADGPAPALADPEEFVKKGGIPATGILSATVPAVVDGDALTAIGTDVVGVVGPRTAATILTPHAGELARLTGTRPGPDRLEEARSLAARTGAIVLSKGPTTVVEPAVTRDHTERMLLSFGCRVDAAHGVVTLTPPARLEACSLEVPGDFSSSAFFLVAGSIAASRGLNEGLTITGVGVNPTSKLQSDGDAPGSDRQRARTSAVVGSCALGVR